MQSFEDLLPGEPLACLADASDRTWALFAFDDSANRLVGFVTDAGHVQIEGYLDGETGDVFDCHERTDAPVELFRQLQGIIDIGPAVHVIGSLDDAAGQITVRQEQGNYLRICRWDRVESAMPALRGTSWRTLPQCGCGGSLGTPKLFASFAEMSAYHFCAFYL